MSRETKERYMRLTLWLAVTVMDAIWEVGTRSKIAIHDYSKILTCVGRRQGLSI